MNPSNIDISIIIVNYKSWSHLEQCLFSIKKINTNSLTFEVLVIDNFSDDGRLEDFSKQFPEFTFIINSGNNGFSNGCNLGAKEAQGDYLMFLNPDTLITEEALGTLYSTIKKHPEFKLLSCDKVTAKGKLEKIDKNFPSILNLFGLVRAVKSYFGNQNTGQKVETGNSSVVFPYWLSGSLIFMSKEWFKKIGGWNEDYWMYYEDVDLCKRTVELNGKIALTKKTSIIHNHGGASRINVKTAALTKSEVIISRHVYINNHFKGIAKILSHFILALVVIFEKSLLAVLGLILFFKPKLLVNVYLFFNMIKYYWHVLLNRSWLSIRSMNFKKQ